MFIFKNEMKIATPLPGFQIASFCVFPIIFSMFLLYAMCRKTCRYNRAGRLATGWTVRGLDPGGGKVFRTSSDRP
jgi:hypothetical protein